MNLDLEKELIKHTLQFFIDGFDNLDGSVIAKAFHPKARLYSNIDGRFIDQSIEEFCNSFETIKNYPEHTYNKEKCKKSIKFLDIFENAASVKVEWRFSKFTYHDYYNMLKIGEQWVIMNKVFSKEII